MQDIWVTSDLHFGHVNICNFLRSDGDKVRPWDNYEEMDEALIKNFNETVKPNDKVYILGDVAINRRALPTLARLHCKDMILIKGNHDIFRLEEYTPYFRDIRAYHVLKNVLLSHIPIHPSEMSRWSGQLHGHLHSNLVMLENGMPDRRYINVCVEHHNFRPVLLNDMLAQVKELNTA